MNKQEEINYLREHLHYEVLMLRYAYQRIHEVKHALDRNAFIECFALHARVLYEFLVSMKDKGNRTVVAHDYVDGFQPRRKDLIWGKITTLNQQILHAGTTRTANPQLKFGTNDGADVLQWIESTLVKFISEIKPPYPTDWLPTEPQVLVITPGMTPSASSLPEASSGVTDVSTTTTSETKTAFVVKSLK